MERKKTTFFGFDLMRASERSGVAYSNVWRHAHGERKISAEMALRYNDALGIPLSDMRPDLWQPQAKEASNGKAEA